MSVFGANKDLLVAIRDGQKTIESWDAPAFRQLLAQGLVTATKVGERRYLAVALTPAGKALTMGEIQRA